MLPVVGSPADSAVRAPALGRDIIDLRRESYVWRPAGSPPHWAREVLVHAPCQGLAGGLYTARPRGATGRLSPGPRAQYNPCP